MLVNTSTLTDAIQAAVDLDASENPEYMRGMCELIARCFPVMYMHTDERAEQIQALVLSAAQPAVTLNRDAVWPFR